MTVRKTRAQTATDQPDFRQAQAADPLKSVWVGASAGTGKTKVLIDRVLRLMLPRPGLGADSATPPGKILCLTFTKTAAAEMSSRIYERLSAWSVLDDESLAQQLAELTGNAADSTIQSAARRLFAEVLDTPGGLKIMTLHAFCQSVLKRFPVEADVAPHFELMDEQSAIEYLTQCLHGIIHAARAQPSTLLAQAFDMLALHLDTESMSDLMSKIMAKRSLLAEIFRHHGDAEGSAEKTVAALRAYLQLLPTDTLASQAADFCARSPDFLPRALKALLKGLKKDNARAAILQRWLEAPSARAQMVDDYISVYLTKEHEVLASLASKGAVEDYPDIVSHLQEEAARVQAFVEARKLLRFFDLNAALLRIAAEMVGRYERHKRHSDKLDFDDLVIKTCDLLAGEGNVPWVLYKLDEGIDHMLVDEAQDTSPYQWRVIQALSEEYFSGRGTRDDVTRTLFVVGDEKQSIFSFQGADPDAFARLQAFFGARAVAVQEGWEVLLEHSFRSGRAVLEVVDHVFALPDARRGVVADALREIRHLLYRTGQAGVVELWPLLTQKKRAEKTPWRLPTDIDIEENAASALTRAIAGTIKTWLETGEVLASKGRAIRPGDILILVQSRGAFVDRMLRDLKEANVPVAGIDRLMLTEEISVLDLLALADFALLPKDDLTLATVLKTPLVGLDDDDLFDLCHDRRTSLWSALQDKKPAVAEYLRRWVERVSHATPYEFFSEILCLPCVADERSGKRAFFARLGFDIQDALDEFLNRALTYEQTHAPSIQKFISWFMKGEAEIKREQDVAGDDRVRIMTVHAAKGLQAPIVFLPDMAKKIHDHNKGRVRLIWPPAPEGVPLWSPRQEFDAKPYQDVQAAAAERQEQEYRRLLYVALTRAEDRLYLVGSYNQKKKNDCWYDLVEKAFPPFAEEKDFMVGAAVQRDVDGKVQRVRRLEYPQESAVEKDRRVPKAADAARSPLPAWASIAPVSESFPPAPLAPSRPDDDEPAVKSPLGGDQGWKFRRGNIVHQILDVLPQLPPVEWEKSLAAYLARPALEIPAPEQKNFAREILAVLNHPDFAPIFGEGSQSEVPVVGLTGAKILSGQMDRILVLPQEVLVVDYKTNRPPPKKAEDVPVIYLKQMAAYASVMRNIYPNRKIKCALLWTDGPYLMPLPDKLLEPYLV